MNKHLHQLAIGLFLFFAVFISNKAIATHLYGADLAYTYLSGANYKITLTLYANCAGANFPTLNGSTAQVQVYNGSIAITNLVLSQDSTPVEVTPVCPSQANQTACFFPNSVIPGIKRFIYSATYSVGALSSNWRFRFNGQAGGSTGRSNDITNIVGGSTMALEATLNNTLGPNSSPVYTTIPTPFFCINKPASYNPGTVDADGDLLAFSLVPGILPTAGVVSYLTSYTATNPLASVAGTFSFSAANGQLDFTPNITQKSLVVSQVSEYRGTTLVGTSMREMTFVALPCLNNPPVGNISNPSPAITVINNTTVSICNEKGPFTYNINPTDIDANAINVSVSGLPAGATFTITNNNTINPTGLFSWDVRAVAPGNYTYFITYTDNGCPLASKQTVAYTVTVLPNPKLTFTLISPATCFAKAVFSVTTAAANTPYVINFGTTTRSGVTGAIVDSLIPGAYTFTITAPNGCSHDTSIRLISPATTIISAQIAQNTCNATANGRVTLAASNGASPYTYSVNAGTFAASANFSSLAAGTYVFRVKDQMGCIKDTSITISDSLNVYPSTSVSNVLCNGGSSGAIQLNGTGGIGPYVYALNTNSFSANNVINSLVAGTYAVHVKDNLGCYKDTTAVIAEPTKLKLNAGVTDVLCSGDSSGIVVLSASGGTPGYTYAKGTGAFSSGNTFLSVRAGIHTFKAQDANGCQVDTTTVQVLQPTPLMYSVAIAGASCNGTNSGSITISGSGGRPGYTFAINALPYTLQYLYSGLGAGVYVVHAKDANGCTKDSSVTVTQPAVVQLNQSYSDPTCYGANNGAISIAGTGGTLPYNYSVNNLPYANGNITGLGPGSYSVTLRDAHNCVSSALVTIVEPPMLKIQASIKRPYCNSVADGSVIFLATGGTPGYTYGLQNRPPASSPVISNLAAGSYAFRITDSRGCSKDTTIVIKDSISVQATTIITRPKCFGGADGSISINPAMGMAPYTYAINTGIYSTNNPISNLAAGTHHLHIKDANGCTLDTLQIITQPTVIASNAAVTQPLCYQGTDGHILIGASGGTPAYTYALGSGAFSGSGLFNGLSAGAHIVHVKDANNCIRDTVVQLAQPTALNFALLTLSHNFCNGDSSGFVKAFASGATPPYTYAADSGSFSTTNLLQPLRAGARIIHIRDANGCTRDTMVRLNEPTKIHLNIDTLIHPTCEGYKDGSVKIAGAIGGNPGYTYTLGDGIYSNQLSYGGLGEGVYTFYAKDDFGCIVDTTINLKGYPHLKIGQPVITNVRCYGEASGAFDLVAAGGNPSYTYYVKSPADTAKDGHFDSLAHGTYTIHIVDSTGCFKDTTVVVTQPDSLQLTVTTTSNDCNGLDNAGAVSVGVSGGTGPYSYVWNGNPGQATNVITGVNNGIYRVVVSDALLCLDSATTTVGYDNCCKPTIVNAFTPNGDGRNDRFHVLFKGDMKLKAFSIYNRFGQRLFFTTSSGDGWDGTWNNVPQDLGTYFYYIKLICGNNGDNVLEFKGDFTLIR